MAQLPWKKVLFGLAALGVLLAGILYFQNAGSKGPAIATVNPAFGEYITSYTAGVVSSGSSFRITLAVDPEEPTSPGETSARLFDFNPSLKGVTVWLDHRTVEFRPSERLRSGQVYEVSFALYRLIQVPPSLQNLEYSVRVIPQNFSLSVERMKPYVQTELKRQKIEGLIQTADFAPNEAVEKMLTAEQAGKILAVSWVHTEEGKHHNFTVEEVSRGEGSTQVKISADGNLLGVDQKEEQLVEVPALGDFKVMGVRVEQGSSQFVTVQFSDPLSERQRLEGLITISDIPSLDYEISGNEIHIYPPVRQTGSRTLTIEPGIRNILDYRMAEGGVFDLAFEQVAPSVRFVGKGSILPSSDGMILPFEAVNLKSVDIRIIRIFESNVLQFLQVNDLEGNSELRRVGKPLVRTVLSLENSGVTDLGRWNRYTLDLSKYVQSEPGAIYQVSIGFRRSYSVYNCSGSEAVSSEEPEVADNWDQPVNEESAWDSYEDYYYNSDYQWEERDNPCSSSYYTSNRTVRRNVIASDLGLAAKSGGDGSTYLFVNNLKTTEPMSGVQLELYNFQQELIGSASTGPDGKAVIISQQNPFVVIAKSEAQRGYLRLEDGQSLSLSNFDVGGEKVNKGIKGLIYGERGVWRPGDSLYLTFLLEDKLKLLPEQHPVVMELKNPQGFVTQRLVRSSSENGFYKFATVTSPDAPTGNWTANVKVGGTSFTQTVKIETVKPNRLKIDLNFGRDRITAGNENISGTLQVNWLHGAPGRNLKAEFEVLLTAGQTRFDRYPDFVFDDPTREVTSEARKVFEGYTDDDGHAVVNTTLDMEGNPPGVMNAIFRGKVFEESGNFSIDRFVLPFYPYPSFTGIRLPQGDKARGMLLTDTTHQVEIVTVDANGNGLSRPNIEVTISKLEWRWWWDNSEGNANYMSAANSTPVASGRISTVNGKGSWSFKIKYPEWGRYLVRARDMDSNHSTAKVIYVDWPGWAGRARNEAQGATMLTFASDKPSYQIGEKATLVIPGSDNGRALVSIESGSSVLQTYWINTHNGDNPFTFEVLPNMAPNVYAHVTLLQPHAQTINDLPMRMYGVIPIMVEDSKTHLEPAIQMPDVLEPGQEVTIKVSEKNKRKMSYTLAVVDEGLLDITRYRTPEVWSRFYAREALGVKTWDLYDEVMGAFGGKVERLLAIGGDMMLKASQDDARMNRFKPVVKFLGPFTLDGGEQTHRFIMPSYIGSVKTMLVAGYQGAYGTAEKTTPVRKPLMVLATLPRVLGPEEKVSLPVTLFTMEKGIKNVKVEIKVTGPVSVAGESSRSVTMDRDNLTTDFDLAVKSETGSVHIEVYASSGAWKAADAIDLEVRNPNPPVTSVTEALLENGKSWSGNITPVGLAGTNSAVLEISTLPAINLGQRLRYLMEYPHGCIEQTTSAVFAQLYLDQVKSLSNEEKASIQNNVKAAVERIKLFVTRDGGFSYWPGNEDSDSWGSTYAGHFLLEAEAKGYFIPNEMLRRWKKYQRTKSLDWRKNRERQSSELIQAYRLYTLALAGDPDIASMNRMREAGNLPLTAAWMLVATYAKAGQAETARTLASDLATSVKPYSELAGSYGSDIRDKAIILETLLLLNERPKAFELVKDISQALSNTNYWMSTQATAWSLKSVSQFAAGEKRGPLKFNYSWYGKTVTAVTDLPMAQVPITIEGNKMGALSIESQTLGPLFVRIILQGTPARGLEQEAKNNLAMDISYSKSDGSYLDPFRLQQGDEFIATVTVSNPGLKGDYRNMVLQQIFPSGWEINNLRLEEAEDRLLGDKPNYQDIRDDRVYTYFDLPAAQRVIYRVMLTASYAGSYYLPAVSCEAMYDRSIYSRTRGQTVDVVKKLIP